MQIPTFVPGLLDLDQAAESQTYCDDIKGRVAAHGLAITELSTQLPGQLVATHRAYDALYDGFAPERLRGNPVARQQWAVTQLRATAKASGRLGIEAHATFSGALA